MLSTPRPRATEGLTSVCPRRPVSVSGLQAPVPHCLTAHLPSLLPEMPPNTCVLRTFCQHLFLWKPNLRCQRSTWHLPSSATQDSLRHSLLDSLAARDPVGGTQLVSSTHACTYTPCTCHRKLALGLLHISSVAASSIKELLRGDPPGLRQQAKQRPSQHIKHYNSSNHNSAIKLDPSTDFPLALIEGCLIFDTPSLHRWTPKPQGLGDAV